MDFEALVVALVVIATVGGIVAALAWIVRDVIRHPGAEVKNHTR